MPPADDDDESPMAFEFSFSGFAEAPGGDLPDFSPELVHDMNLARYSIQQDIAREIVGLLPDFVRAQPGRTRRNPDDLLEVGITFHSGSLLWDGFVVVRDALAFSYLGNTVVNDVAILGGLAAFYDLFRRAIADRIDKVVGRHMQRSAHIGHNINPVTRTVQTTQMIDTVRVLQRHFDRLERQIDALRFRSRMTLASAIAAIILGLVSIIAVRNDRLAHFLTLGMGEISAAQFVSTLSRSQVSSSESLGVLTPIARPELIGSSLSASAEAQRAHA